MTRNTQIQKVSVVCGHKRPRKTYRRPQKSYREPHTTSFGVPQFKIIPAIHHQPPPFQMPLTLEPKEPLKEPLVAPPKSLVKIEPSNPLPADFPQQITQPAKTPQNLPTAAAQKTLMK